MNRKKKINNPCIIDERKAVVLWKQTLTYRFFTFHLYCQEGGITMLYR